MVARRLPLHVMPDFVKPLALSSCGGVACLAVGRTPSRLSRAWPPALWAAVMIAVLLCAGCSMGRKRGDTTHTTPSAPSSAAEPERGGADPAPTPKEPAGAAPAAVALPAAEVSKLVSSAEAALQDGQEDRARADLQRALAADPGHKLGQLLMQQITDDPVVRLGKESSPYTLRPNDSLSKLARTCLGDVHLFYILARYNDIKVPSRVAEGQVVRIPARCATVVRTTERHPSAPPTPAPAPTPPAPATAPVPPAPPPPATPAPPAPPPVVSEAERAFAAGSAARRAGQLDAALVQFQKAEAAGHPKAAAQVAEVRKALVERHSRDARAAVAQQKLDAALRHWDRVLELDPGNDTARVERQRVEKLKAKAERL
jgi:tetratricopeptide (TPR) repeat protein